MNIKFSYVYRDASNYKQYNEVVFANQNELPIEQIQRLIYSNLIDENWFVAKDWYLPDLHFKDYDWDDDIDHDWHELASVEETNEPVTLKISIDNLIDLLSINGRQ
jgi:hypothetical protein